MKTRSSKAIIVWITIVMSCLLAIGVRDAISQPPPVSAPLVREGNFALQLAQALNLGQPASEAEAENMLGAVGIAPRNGWIADYPVTPDIIGELRDSVGYAAQAKTISMDQNSALNALATVEQGASVTLTPAPAGPPPANAATVGAPQSAEEGAPAYPDPTAVGDYYSQQGPPVLTYYAPPPDYYYLYTWVPYPFWWSSFWFGGYFILNDFHRFYRDHDYRGVHNHFVSNHFNDVNAHHVFRIDPVSRLHGNTFAGIGAPRGVNSINTGVKGSPERVFNNNRAVAPRSSTNIGQSRSGTTGTVSRAANPFHQSKVYSQPPGGGRKYVPSSSRAASAPRGGGHAAAPHGGGHAASASHGGGGGGGKR
jgi:hypothetical protein